MSGLGQSRRFGDVGATSGLTPKTDIYRKGRHVSKVPTTEVARSFDHFVATRQHLAAMVIRAVQLAAILLHIARGLRPAKGPPGL